VLEFAGWLRPREELFKESTPVKASAEQSQPEAAVPPSAS